MRTDRMPSGLPRRENFPTNITPEPMMHLTVLHMEIKARSNMDDEKAKSRMEDEGGSQNPPADPPITTTPSTVPSEITREIPVTTVHDSPATVAQADGC
jgi:hypothetical protein